MASQQFNEFFDKFKKISSQDGSLDSIELNFLQLAKVIWAEKKIAFLIFLFFFSGLAAYSFSIENMYTSSALLIPSNSLHTQNTSSFSGQFGGLASLAGININSSQRNEAIFAIEILKSRKFILDFVKKQKILAKLLAVKKWDSENNQLIYDKEKFDPVKGQWIEKDGQKPSNFEIYETFKSRFSVVYSAENNLVTLSVEHLSPHVAKEWVELLILSINNERRKEEIGDATNNIEYLNHQLGKTSLADMKSVFYSLIENETKRLMLAQTKYEYVFKSIDPAYLPDFKSYPNRTTWIIVGFIISLIMGFLVALAAFFFRVIYEYGN